MFLSFFFITYWHFEIISQECIFQIRASFTKTQLAGIFSYSQVPSSFAQPLSDHSNLDLFKALELQKEFFYFDFREICFINFWRTVLRDSLCKTAQNLSPVQVLSQSFRILAQCHSPNSSTSSKRVPNLAIRNQGFELLCSTERGI